MSGMHEVQSSHVSSNLKNPENQTNSNNRDATPGSDLWTDGLICAFEYVKIPRRISRSKYGSKIQSLQQVEGDSMKKQVPEDRVYGTSYKKFNRKNLSESESLGELRSGHITSLDNLVDHQSSLSDHYHMAERFSGSRWVPIGWARISELVQTVQADAGWALQQQFELLDNEDERSVADLATPYWEQPAGPAWWCHVAAGHQLVDTWLSNSQWLHPAIRTALRDESRLISERMKYLLYEVPVRVAGGLLFELLGQSAGDPFHDEDDIPIVLRSWHAQRFLVTALHVKGHASSINVLGITEVQELLSAGSYNEPKTVHDIIALLATRLSRWDDRLFRKSIFGAADEVELKFMNRRHQEDMNLLSIILNQEIRRLSRQVIRVKWSLHAREEIVFELLQHLRGDAARSLLQGVMKNTREMIEEQEAVRGRLFTIQDVMQSTVRAWLQDRSLRVTHNLAVFGGCGLVLSIITGLFGINVDGIPGASGTPYAFGLFAAILFLIGMILIAFGLLYLGLKKPITEAQVEFRKLELQQLVKSFQHEAETHAQVSKSFPRNNLTPTAADIIPADADYVVIR